MSLIKEKSKNFNSSTIDNCRITKEQFYQFIKGNEIVQTIKAKVEEIEEFKAYWNNVFGGISGIYQLTNDQPIMHKQLCEFFDTIILDDRVLRHDVLPIFPKFQVSN
jgi:hypothetical protein